MAPSLEVTVSESPASRVTSVNVCEAAEATPAPRESAATAAAITVFVPLAWTLDVASLTTISAPRALEKTTLKLRFILLLQE